MEYIAERLSGNIWASVIVKRRQWWQLQELLFLPPGNKVVTFVQESQIRKIQPFSKIVQSSNVRDLARNSENYLEAGHIFSTTLLLNEKEPIGS